MQRLADFIDAVERYRRNVEEEVRRARSDGRFGAELQERWRGIQEGVGTARTAAGLELPRLALPPTDEPGEIARYLLEEGLPGEFPHTTAAYREMYLEGPE